MSKIPNLSKIKLNTIGRARKIGCERNVASVLLLQRQMLHIFYEDIDVTPKPLVHTAFCVIDENKMTALETIGLFQTGSDFQLMVSSSRISGLRASSSLLLKSSSIASNDLQMESLLSTQICSYLPIEKAEDTVPLPFFLSRDESEIFATRPEAVTIILKETQTFFIFEMIQMTENLQTPEGQVVQRENENYEYMILRPGSNRKLLNVETQTIQILMKSRGTYLGMRLRKNQDAFVNNWVIHDTYAMPELIIEKNGHMIVHSKESMRRIRKAQVLSPYSYF